MTESPPTATPIVGVDAAGRHVIVLPAVRGTGTDKWSVGQFGVRLSCGEVLLSWGSGEIDMCASAAEGLGAALGAAAIACRNQPAQDEVTNLAQQLAAADTDWHRVDPGDRHHAQADRMLRTFALTLKEPR